MEDVFSDMKIKFDNLVTSDFLDFETVSLKKNVMGVYAIYNDKNNHIYIGCTNKFHVRFGTDLRYESTHTLMGKLLKTGEYRDRSEVVDFFIKRCKIKVEIYESKREAEALEGMAIFALDPLFNK